VTVAKGGLEVVVVVVRVVAVTGWVTVTVPVSNRGVVIVTVSTTVARAVVVVVVAGTVTVWVSTPFTVVDTVEVASTVLVGEGFGVTKQLQAWEARVRATPYNSLGESG
jgi:hypothetical protein